MSVTHSRVIGQICAPTPATRRASWCSSPKCHSRGGLRSIVDSVMTCGVRLLTLTGAGGKDRMFGGTQNDNVHGGDGDDVLHGDSGIGTIKGTDFGSDNLKGGRGRDILYQSDGNDTLTGGADADMFYFKWQDPMINLAVGTGRSFATLTDFDARQDKLVFDVAGLGRDAAGANFIDGGNGTPGGKAASTSALAPSASGRCALTRARSRCTRFCWSTSTAAGPNSSASSPAAVRRIRSISK